MSVFDELRWRGVVYAASDGVEEQLRGDPLTLYAGFDPSAASLHVGSLMPVLSLARLQRAGHRPIALVGGGTGLIGDPSGKTQERQLLTEAQVEENLDGIRGQLERFLDFDSQLNPAIVANNGDWLRPQPLLGFLRDVGKHFTVNYMLAKESVQRRLEQEEGISYTEFSYLLLQAYDFLVLHDRYGCSLQVGGSDQWGNITAGTELIRKLRRQKAYGLVFPLVTTASGAKFGKSEAGAIWLDPEWTSPYRFYQFWLNTADEDASRYLRYFTFLSRAEIESLEASLTETPERREAQKRLAYELCGMVHGETARDRAVRSSEILFGGAVEGLAAREILDIFDEVPSSRLARASLAGEGLPLVDLIASCGLAPSKGAARRLARDGGAYLNNRRIRDERRRVTAEDFLDGEILIVRKGQKQYHLFTLEE